MLICVGNHIINGIRESVGLNLVFPVGCHRFIQERYLDCNSKYIQFDIFSFSMAADSKIWLIKYRPPNRDQNSIYFLGYKKSPRESFKALCNVIF
jgi:hypothetical protein